MTINFATKINSILREVDGDPQPLVDNADWPAFAFNCRQAWTGYVQNYIAGVRLQGNLKIAPAITPTGALRIAKATLSSLGNKGTQIGLAACLFPHQTFATMLSAAGTPATQASTAPKVPGPPISPGSASSAPTVPCNSAPFQAVALAGVAPLTAPGVPYTTSSDGSKVSVAGDLTVNNVEADILIGGNQANQ